MIGSGRNARFESVSIKFVRRLTVFRGVDRPLRILGFRKIWSFKNAKGLGFRKTWSPVLKGNFWAFGRFGAPKALKGSFWAFGRFGAPETLKGNFCKKSRNTLGSLQLRFVVHSQKRR